MSSLANAAGSKPNYLMSIPAEIRNQIVEYTIRNKDYFTWEVGVHRRYDEHYMSADDISDPEQNLSLLTVNRQIGDETRERYWKNAILGFRAVANRTVFPNGEPRLDRALPWLLNEYAPNLKFIRHIHMDFLGLGREFLTAPKSSVLEFCRSTATGTTSLDSQQAEADWDAGREDDYDGMEHFNRGRSDEAKVNDAFVAEQLSELRDNLQGLKTLVLHLGDEPSDCMPGSVLETELSAPGALFNIEQTFPGLIKIVLTDKEDWNYDGVDFKEVYTRNRRGKWVNQKTGRAIKCLEWFVQVD